MPVYIFKVNNQRDDTLVVASWYCLQMSHFLSYHKLALALVSGLTGKIKWN